MNIIFLTIIRIESLEEKNLYTDLMQEFVNNGHNVYIISPVEKRYNKNDIFKTAQNCTFLQIATGNIFGVNLIEKGISTLTIEHLFIRGIKKHIGDKAIDLVLYSTPPITFGKVVKYIKDKYHAKSYLLLKDIFPQNAVDLKMIRKNGILYRFFRMKEKELYKNSDYIGCMSEANCKYLITKNAYLTNKIIEVCPNTITPSQQECVLRQNILQRYGIPSNKVVYLYGGNLGKPQGIDFMLECFTMNSEHKEAYFVICGTGSEYEKIKAYIAENKLNNVKLMSWLEKIDYSQLAGACDVGLLFLDKKFTIPNFPSRLLSYMDAGLPVLAVTDSNTDIGDIICDGEFGMWCESRRAEDFTEKINQLCSDKEALKEMGRKSRLYLENHYTSAHSYQIIMKHFNEQKEIITHV